MPAIQRRFPEKVTTRCWKPCFGLWAGSVLVQEVERSPGTRRGVVGQLHSHCLAGRTNASGGEAVAPFNWVKAAPSRLAPSRGWGSGAVVGCRHPNDGEFVAGANEIGGGPPRRLAQGTEGHGVSASPSAWPRARSFPGEAEWLRWCRAAGGRPRGPDNSRGTIAWALGRRLGRWRRVPSNNRRD